ncbi:PTS sugar transporter subunit IIA [Lactobacillus pasteurii]|uniref:Phosphoenolpyruvate-dependent sugar phosphotransferase system EIIA, mannose specific n=1 Tax=Lactobacillus pasteurii DSM 23907 = CRBIP 24.76 TaxID=1423790 RepID=I7IYJ8_9LACO|nr:PTS sugar transporter subunit IIA [Lactobacillus pasteurii]TDG77468.1 hypothetical protein C5L33_000911 [Lactobacillus pasteurii]CCI84542.1 Phosphoenolpyruvate-dependent sugar phosphotransferase system EIIA, mannose specific [Lactobacillus pasteurii DSM 23907 = CRBIP 24.76]
MSKDLILISHGQMAAGVKESCELIMGPQEHVHAVCLLPEEGPEDFEVKFNKEIEACNDDEILVFADLMGGTPANTISRLIMSGKKIHLIVGMNLAMVIEWVNSQMVGTEGAYVLAAKNGIVDVNNFLANMKK